MTLKRKTPFVLAPFAVACLSVASCGITEDEPSPPATTDLEPTQESTQEPTDDATAETEQSEPAEDVSPALDANGVSAGHEQAVDAAERILDEGGNAVDASIAAAFAIGVLEPVASGMGEEAPSSSRAQTRNRSSTTTARWSTPAARSPTPAPASQVSSPVWGRSMRTMASWSGRR